MWDVLRLYPKGKVKPLRVVVVVTALCEYVCEGVWQVGGEGEEWSDLNAD